MIQQIAADKLPLILNWAADEGWNPGLEDALPFHAADPHGFFVKSVNDIPIAAISVVNHSADFAFLGLYLCRPEYRGQGHGIDLWNHAIRHAGDRTIGLDGVPDQQGNYQKSGFVLHSQTVRWQGRIDGVPGGGVSVADVEDIDFIAVLDSQQVGFQRPRFLTEWLRSTPTRRTLVLKEVGKITGYGTIRACLEGVKIGPFSAQTAADAHILLGALSAALPQAEVGLMIDVAQSAPGLAALLKTRGFSPGFETARMYKGEVPEEKPAPFQAVATLELG